MNVGSEIPKSGMCLSNGGDDVAKKIPLNVEELVTKKNCSVGVIATTAMLHNELDSSSGSSTAPCSDEFSTDDDESAHKTQRRRPSLVLQTVKHALEGGSKGLGHHRFGFDNGNKSSSCTELDLSHRSAKFDLSPEESDDEKEESPPCLTQDVMDSVTSPMDSSRHQVSPQKPSFQRNKSTPTIKETSKKPPLPRIMSTPAMMQHQRSAITS